MSTRPETTYDDTTTSSRTEHPTNHDDFSTTTPSTPSDATTTPLDGPSWTDQCKRQFSTTRTTRCRNLADDENHAMHDGV
jgi:hypothetical protein